MMEDTLSYKANPAIYSLILHGLLLLLILWFFETHRSTDTQNVPIEIKEISKKYGEKVARAQHLRSSTQKSERIPSLSDLGMKLSTEANFQMRNAPNSTDTSEVADEGGWDVLNPDPRVARFNQYIFQTVQGWLDRDAPLNRQPISGIVSFRAWFTADGEYLENETEFDAVDQNFKEIVARALRKSFANPIPRPYLFQKEKFSIERRVVVRNY